MGILGRARIGELVDACGVQETEPIERPWLTKAIEGAQTRVEGQNFDIRKNLLEYDDVMNQQRKTHYGMRKEVLAAGARTPLGRFIEGPKNEKETPRQKNAAMKEQEEQPHEP